MAHLIYEPGDDLLYADRVLDILNPKALFRIRFIIPGEPYPKPRPRFSKSGHAYSTAEMRANEEVTGTLIRSQIHEPFDGNLAIALIFFRSTRRRVDYDNLVKHVLDAAQGIAFYNDDQITASFAAVEYDKHNPRTIMALCDHISTMTRATKSRK